MIIWIPLSCSRALSAKIEGVEKLVAFMKEFEAANTAE